MNFMNLTSLQLFTDSTETQYINDIGETIAILKDYLFDKYELD